MTSFTILFNHSTTLTQGNPGRKETGTLPHWQNQSQNQAIRTVGTVETARLGQEAQKTQSPFQNFLPHKGAFQTHGPQMDNPKQQRCPALCWGKQRDTPVSRGWVPKYLKFYMKCLKHKKNWKRYKSQAKAALPWTRPLSTWHQKRRRSWRPPDKWRSKHGVHQVVPPQSLGRATNGGGGSGESLAPWMKGHPRTVFKTPSDKERIPPNKNRNGLNPQKIAMDKIHPKPCANSRVVR